MKKNILLWICFFLMSIHYLQAYSPSQTLEKKIKWVAERLDAAIEKKWNNKRKSFLRIIENYKNQYIWDERATYILWYLYSYLSTKKEICKIFDNFLRIQENKWFVLNDGVMGWLSKWQIITNDNTLIFSGNINTNGGGFSSIRSRLSVWSLKNTTHIKLRVKSDLRNYKLSLRENYWNGISYQANIQSETPWEFENIHIPLSSLRPNYFGRPINVREFRKKQAWEIGFIISDGIDGSFKLEIDTIEFCEW